MLRKYVEIIMRDWESRFLGIHSQCDWLRVLLLVTVALVYYLK